MKSLQSYFLASITCGILFSCNSSKTELHLTNEFITANLKEAVKQYNILSSNVPVDLFPKTYLLNEDSLETGGSGSWIAGFYPGTLLYLYEFSKDENLLNEAKRKLRVLEKEKLNRGTHDLGFMLYCSFGNAFRITKDPEYKSIMITGAESLISRFNPTVGCIKSWDYTNDGEWKYPVIIDNMMNLELLNWASRETKDGKYENISIKHSNTTLENHFRNDFSSYHVIDYDPETGNVLNKHTHQGAAHESAWARGQAWALYGYTMMYRDTKDKTYLNQAINIADFIINHPNLPEDKIPYWDFDAENIPNAYKDASSAAIMSSALLELSTYCKSEKSKIYLEVAEKMIQSLSGEPYKNKLGSNGGFLLKHSTGHLPRGSEIDVPLSYADYYYVEALMRYRYMLSKR